MEFKIIEVIDPRIIEGGVYKAKHHIRGLQKIYLIYLSIGRKLYLVYPKENEVPVLIRGKSNKKLSRLRTKEVDFNKKLRAVIGCYMKYEFNLMSVDIDNGLYWTLYCDPKIPIEDLSVIITMLSKIKV